MAKSTQAENILRYINETGSITALEAATEIGCLQLAARICDLEKLGYCFRKVRITVPTRYGKTSVVRYSLA